MPLEGAYAFDAIGSATVPDLSGHGRVIDLAGLGAQVDSAGVLDDGALSKTTGGTIALPAGLLAASETDDRTLMIDAAALHTTWWIRWESFSLDTGVFGLLSLDGGLSLSTRGRDQGNSNPAGSAVVGALEAGERHNYAITYVRATGVLSRYYDGALIGTQAFAAGTALFVGADELNMAEWGSADAALDNLRIFSHALTGPEVAALAGTPVVPAAEEHSGEVTLPASVALEVSGTSRRGGTVALGTTADLAVSGTKRTGGTVAVAATAGLTPSGHKVAGGLAGLPASTGLLVSGGKVTSGGMVLAVSAGLAVSGVSRRSGQVALRAGVHLTVGPAGAVGPEIILEVVVAEQPVQAHLAAQPDEVSLATQPRSVSLEAQP